MRSADQPATLAAINGEKANSCGMGRWGFLFMGKPVNTVTRNGQVWAIRQILVMGAFVDGQYGDLEPLPQFAAFLTNEEGA